MHELTGFQRDLLFVIAAENGQSGQDIKAKMDPHVGEVNHGRLYPNLDTLIERGLVVKGEIDRRTNSYDISDIGRQMLAGNRRWQNVQLRQQDRGREIVEGEILEL